jgi:competence protein ComEA
MLPDESSSSSSRFAAFFETLLSVYRYHVLIALGAVFVIGLVFLFLKGGIGGLNTEGKVEILSATTSGEVKGEATQEVVVEISGEVQKPGVYSLPVGSRIDDLLQKADGVTEEADIDWMSKALNKAAKLVDGQKLYIPARNASHSDAGGPKQSEKQESYQTPPSTAGFSTAEEGNAVSRTIISEPSSGLVNINSASLKELDKLPGIGPVYAQKIIDQRPYSNINELSSKKVVPKSTYEKMKDKISVY